MKATPLTVLLIACLGAAFGCEQDSLPNGASTRQPAPENPEAPRAVMLKGQLRGEVETVDVEARTVTLRTEGGSVTLPVEGPRQQLEALHPGATFSADYEMTIRQQDDPPLPDDE